MNDDKLFLVAVGGTGMRCLESFVYLCAMGMMDNKEIEVLTIDTDSNNGNKERSEQVIDLYTKIKSSGNNKEGRVSQNSFFSAKINLFKYAPDYSQDSKNTFSKISDTFNELKKSDNKLLTDLFLDPSTAQQFNLSHGYRAQTHLGSYLMYHSIVDAARVLKKDNKLGKNLKELEQFMEKLSQVGEKARVFIFGSIFGGTGASGIPVLPKAFEKFTEIWSEGKSTINLSNTKFGATLLTEYFKFNQPTTNTIEDEKVIADSNLFPLNSQAALQFYQGDPTVHTTYKILYQIGWPFNMNGLGDSERGNIITGGAAQKNPAHIVELLAAGAAFDFFTRDSFTGEIEYVFNSVLMKDQSPIFSFADIVGDKFKEDFEMKAGGFFSLAHIILKQYNGAKSGNGIIDLVNKLKAQKIEEYSDIPEGELEQINSFFRGFGYSFEENSSILKPGWFYQVQRSILNSTVGNPYFLFPQTSFPDSEKDLKKLDVGKIYGSKDREWKTSWFSNSVDKFISTLTTEPLVNSQNIKGVKEKLFHHIFIGLKKCHNYKHDERE